MRYILKIDYDNRKIRKEFKWRIGKLFQVYYTKRPYIPFISVFRVHRTRKGYHLYMFMDDKEKFRTATEKKLAILVIQASLGSDPIRSAYDYLRVCRNAKVWNILFTSKYLKGKHYDFEEDTAMRDSLNAIINKERGQYG